MKKKKAVWEKRLKKVFDISNDPKKYKELFKKYPGNFITADKAFENPFVKHNSDSLYEIDSVTGERRLKGQFDPINDDDRKATMHRNQSGSDMENISFPEFNTNLPQFNEDDAGAMAELKNMNKMLMSKMYEAYNEDADQLLKQGSLGNIGSNSLLGSLEQNRHAEMQEARNNYKIMSEMFGVTEESDEEDKKDTRNLLKKRKKVKPWEAKLPDTYYRDIAQIKIQRNHIKNNKKNKSKNKKTNSSVDLDAGTTQNFKGKGIYALDQLNPLKLQDIYKQEQDEIAKKIKKKKPKSRQISRHQINIIPGELTVKKEDDESSEPIDQDHIQFQDAEKSIGISTQHEFYKGITSLQEQPNKFAHPKERKLLQKANYPDDRNLNKMHFDVLKSHFNKDEFSSFNVLIHR